MKNLICLLVSSLLLVFSCAKIDSGDCGISNLTATVADCTTDSTYTVVIDFQYANANNDFFDLYIRNDVFIDFFSLSDLPITLSDFQASGLDYDFIKVCINDNPDCCMEIEFMPPDCIVTGTCAITDLVATVGECSSDTTYNLTIDFNHQNAGNDAFDLYVRNDELLGYYNLSDLPLTIPDFTISGFNDDYINVCINDNPDCCAVLEFMPPDCMENNDCQITDLTATVGACTSATTYMLTIDFNYQNAGNDFFDLFIRNNEFVDFFTLADLPITINDFELSGFTYDYIKVCINDVPDCCMELEFMPPDC